MSLNGSRAALFSMVLLAGFAGAHNPLLAPVVTGAVHAAEEKIGPEVTSFFTRMMMLILTTMQVWGRIILENSSL